MANKTRIKPTNDKRPIMADNPLNAKLTASDFGEKYWRSVITVLIMPKATKEAPYPPNDRLD